MNDNVPITTLAAARILGVSEARVRQLENRQGPRRAGDGAAGMNSEAKILKLALKEARAARNGSRRGWEIGRRTIQDELSPADRRRRLREMAACKRQCMKAARLCARIELLILAAEMT